MIIRFGDHGSLVSRLQSKLSDLGYSVEIDGVFGNHTRDAVKAFQTTKSLKPDGIVGPHTLAFLGLLDMSSIETWFPEAIIHKTPMKTRGKYKDEWPQGAIVHFTAGRFGSLKQALNCVDHGVDAGFAYLCIASTGEIVQAHPFSEWGYHAGKSFWPSLGSGVSSKLVGIEITCAGKLKKKEDGTFWSWYGEQIPPSQVRHSSTHDYQGESGFYHIYTPEQEASLIKILIWLKRQNPEVFQFKYVLGHDEVAGKEAIGFQRKNDPGASLSLPMENFRKLLEDEWNRG